MSKRIYTEIHNPNGNLLFTVEQLNNTTQADGKCLPVRCFYCGEIFYISRKQYTDFERNPVSNSLKFCCTEHAFEHRRHNSTNITKPCLVCGKPVTKHKSEVERYPNFFCCQSHAATYNNKLRPPRSEESRQKTSKSVAKYRTEYKLSDHITCYSGNHIAWNGKTVHYNSSYELDYCKVLDEQRIDYDIEALVVEYFNTRKQRNANAIPDFFLPETNTIVEIKSRYTYDQQEMLDRAKAYKKHGYNFKLVLEHQEYEECPPNLLDSTIYDKYPQ